MMIAEMKKNVLKILIAGAIVTMGSANCGAKTCNAKNDGNVKICKNDKQQTGPKVPLVCSENPEEKTLVADFMYFVPLTSLADVEVKISKKNTQVTWLNKCKTKTGFWNFKTVCEFTIQGKGTQTTVFDPMQIIERTLGNEKNKNKQKLTHLLEYIRFDGAGCGKLVIKGKAEKNKEYVTQVVVSFNDKGHKSPVTAGLYDVEANRKGKFKYENRTNNIIARINSLTFNKTIAGKKNKDVPKLAMSLASVYDENKKNGILGNLKAIVANLFIEPIEITVVGNDAMLDFGYAIYKEQQNFVFPKATNIKKQLATEVTENRESLKSK